MSLPSQSHLHFYGTFKLTKYCTSSVSLILLSLCEVLLFSIYQMRKKWLKILQRYAQGYKRNVQKRMNRGLHTSFQLKIPLA